MFPLLVHSILNFPWLLMFALSHHTILQTSPLLPLIIPLPRTLTLTFCVLITTLLHTQLWIHPPFPFPHGPTLAHTSNHPSLCQVCNQIGTTQGCHKGLYHAYKALILSRLLLCHRKPTLTKLEVGPPQLVGLVSDFNALARNGHLRTRGDDHRLLILI